MNIKKTAQEIVHRSHREQDTVFVAHRQPGHVVIGILNEVFSIPRQKQWAMDVDEETNNIIVHCFRQKGHKAQVVPGVKIKVVEPVAPENMFNHITFELVIEGLINVLSGQKINEDFAQIRDEFKKRFEGCAPYHIFEHQKTPPVV